MLTQLAMIGFNQICEHDESGEKSAMSGSRKSSGPKTRMPARKRRR